MSPQPRHTLACIGQVPLKFAAPVRDHLSAVVASPDGRTLWLASGETAAVERLRLSDEGTHFEAHDTFPLRDRLALPGAADEEADIEGLALHDGYLWVVGSHSLARRKPTTDDGPPGAPRQPGAIRRNANRFLFARLPLEGADHDASAVLDKVKRPGGEPLRAGRMAIADTKKALKSAITRSTIMAFLSDDDDLRPFLDIPGKENGFGVGGIAIVGDRVFLGLRGPVQLDQTTVVEISVATGKKGALALAAVGEDGPRYCKHRLDLDGLGVRSLMRRGDDILVLAGPTMTHDGPVRLYAWRGAGAADRAGEVDTARIDYLADLPHGDRDDHAKGMTLLRLPHTQVERLLVVYDSPARSRLIGEHGVLADLFAFPG